ncbi:MAG: DNA primase, partial [Coriobacteriales bacterium]|nr:DNA primase [Coriobacteriales bacterium]
ARISSDDIERVRDASDLLAIASQSLVLKPSGRKLNASCPFHNEKTPSFQIDPQLGLWHCFGCGEGGDVFDFVCRMENVDFPDAVRLLADKAGIELEEDRSGGPQAPKGHKERLKDVCDAACDFYHRELMRSPDPGAAAARSYLASRGFGSAVCKRWKLGYAPGRGKLVAHLKKQGFTQAEIVDANLAYTYESKQGGKSMGPLRDRFYERVMFPIRDRAGRTVAFGGRVIGKGEPKYLNSSETLIFHKSSNLFAIDRARNSITNNARAVVVEGYTDAIAMHEAGIDYVVATLGTALTQQHVRALRSLRPREIIYLFDGDNAGQKAADRAVEFIDQSVTQEAGSAFIDFKVVILPDNQDPMEFVSSKGRDAMLQALDGAVPLIRFAIDRRLDSWDLNSPEQRSLALQAAVELLATIKTSIIAEDYCNYIADRMSVRGRSCDVSTVKAALRKAKPQTAGAQAAGSGADQQPRGMMPASDSQIARYQRELLALALRYPLVQDELRADLSGIDWEAGMPAAVAAQLFPSDGGSGLGFEGGTGVRDVAGMVAALESRVPGSSRYLSSAQMDPGDDQAAALQAAWEMCFALRIQALEETIRQENLKLRDWNSLPQEEYDTIFQHVTDLQKELRDMRLRADRKRIERKG